MSFSFSCGDVLPGCAAHFDADSRADLLAEVARHAEEDHGIRELTPELAGEVDRHVVERPVRA